MNALLKLGTLLYALWQAFQTWRTARRVSAVRTDPAVEWLHKFGGSDHRVDKPASSNDHSGRNSDG